VELSRNFRGGVGLGLYILNQIALAHGGSVRVRSSDEEGTTFTIILPRLPRTVAGDAPAVTWDVSLWETIIPSTCIAPALQTPSHPAACPLEAE